MKVHRRLGPGLLESVYENCLAVECTNCGLRFRRQEPIAVNYDSVKIDCGFNVKYLLDGIKRFSL